MPLPVSGPHPQAGRPLLLEAVPVPAGGEEPLSHDGEAEAQGGAGSQSLDMSQSPSHRWARDTKGQVPFRPEFLQVGSVDQPVPRADLSRAPRALSCLGYTSTPRRRNSFICHFIDGQTEAQRGPVTLPRSHSSEAAGWGGALTLAHMIGRAPLGEVRMGFCTRGHLHIFGGLNRSLPGGWEGISRGGLSLSQNTGTPPPRAAWSVQCACWRAGSGARLRSSLLVVGLRGIHGTGAVTAALEPGDLVSRRLGEGGQCST